jgi:hypothetical protein
VEMNSNGSAAQLNSYTMLRCASGSRRKEDAPVAFAGVLIPKFIV